MLQILALKIIVLQNNKCMTKKLYDLPETCQGFVEDTKLPKHKPSTCPQQKDSSN